MVFSKINGHILLLKNIRQKTDEIKIAIDDLYDYQKSCLLSDRLDILMGIEGNCAKLFFKHHFMQLKHLK